MNKEQIGLIVLIVGISMVAVGVTAQYTQAAYATPVGEVEIIGDVPSEVSPGETFQVSFSAKVDSDYYTGTYTIKAYPRGTPEDESWQGKKDISLDTYWKSSAMMVTAPSEGLWSDYEDLTLSFSGTDDSGYNYLESANTVYIDIVPETVSYNLSISVNGNGSTSPSAGSYTHEEGKSVEVTASPDSGNKFTGWSGDVSSDSKTVTVNMDSDKSITANFEEDIQEYSLSTDVSPSGGGTVSPSSGTYQSGETVTLRASPASGYKFDKWTYDASGTSKTIDVNMDSSKYIVASFVEEEPDPDPEPTTYTVDTNVVSGRGTIDLTPDKVEYEEGEEIVISARPEGDYVFDGWSGDVYGSENPKSITVNSDMTVEASFKSDEPDEVTLTLRSDPTEGGSVSMSKGDTLEVVKGREITVQAYPNQGYTFDHWSGDVSGTSKSLFITMNEDKEAIANFKKTTSQRILTFILSIPGMLVLIGGIMSAAGGVLFVSTKM